MWLLAEVGYSGVVGHLLPLDILDLHELLLQGAHSCGVQKLSLTSSFPRV